MESPADISNHSRRRGGTASLMLGRFVIGIGGIRNNEITDVVMVYDTVKKSWSARKVDGTPRVIYHAVCVFGTRSLYLQGGYLDTTIEPAGGGFYRLDAWYTGKDTFDLGWHELTSNEPRSQHTITLDPETNCLYIWGGQEDVGNCRNDMEEYTVSTALCCKIEQHGQIPDERYRHSMTYVGQSRLLLVGGLSATDTPLTDVHEYDTRNKTWTEVIMAGTIPTRLAGHSTTFVTKARLIILGGNDQCSQGRCLNLAAKAWGPLPAPGRPIPRSGHNTIRQENNLWIFGGCCEEPWQENVLNVNMESPSPSFSADFTASVGSHKLSDAEIVLDDNTRIPVHTLLLSARCDYFDKLIEFQGTEVSHREIRISGVERNTVLQVLTYIYSGVLPQLESFYDFTLLYKLVDRLGIELLKEHATAQLLENIKMENLVPLLNLGNETNSNKIINACGKYLHENRKEALIQNIPQQMDPSVLLSIVQSWLATD